jgi:sulfhydrogenase subunit beta (sulfur reductase)
MATISRDSVQALLDVLVARDFEVIGPTARDGAIVYDRIGRVDDLPVGWTDSQDAGRYRLERRDDGALFGFNLGPQAWKRFLHRPVETLWTMRKDENGTTTEHDDRTAPKYAFIGVRACELQAIAVQDRVFMQALTRICLM